MPEDATEQEVPSTVSHRVEEWERQKGESTKAFSAAKAYFDLGTDRNVRTAAMIVEKSLSLLARWSEQWRWVERAQAYDDHMARLEQTAKEEAVVRQIGLWEERLDAIREREWKAVERMFDLAELIFDDRGKDPLACSLRDAILLFQRASELGRRAVDPSPRPGPRKGGKEKAKSETSKMEDEPGPMTSMTAENRGGQDPSIADANSN